MTMWGIVPAAGLGTRIQPLAFSKELLPVGSRRGDGDHDRSGTGIADERPKAVSEYVVERMLRAGVDKLCFVISPGKSDIVRYYGSDFGSAKVYYVVQPKPEGLCDAIFRAAPLVRDDESVLVGLPDTVWFPEDGYCHLAPHGLAFLSFPVAHPELFDAVVSDEHGRVESIEVKRQGASSHFVWGAFRLEGAVLHALHALWCERGRCDPYVGTLVNEYIARGHVVTTSNTGQTYFDVGTLEGYRRAIGALSGGAPDHV